MEAVGGLEHDDEVAVGEAAEGGVGLEDARGSVHVEDVVVHDLQGRRPTENQSRWIRCLL